MNSRRFLPALLLLFVGSGCAALIYEIVWFQLLELVIGSSTVSLGVLLGTFMGGMCLGSLLFPRIVPAREHPLRLYAFLELGIAVVGLVVLFAMPLVGAIYTAWAGSGIGGILIRGLFAGVCLIPPTLMMGATLPAISRFVETDTEGVSWLGFFYGGNIAGAVVGSLLAGFYLLRVHDVSVATFAAVAINIVVAVLGLMIAKASPYSPPAASGRIAAPALPGAWTVYVTIALSGMTALAAEVVWTRILSLLFGATVYTFSLILAVILVGLGIGSSLGSAMSRGMERPRVALGWCQLLLCAAIAWTAYMLTQSLPYWPINPSISSDPWYTLQLDLVRCLWAVLPAPILWGASFPLALASVSSRGQDPARLVGGVYAANTVGAIIGALAASLVLVAWIGSQHAQQVLILVSALSGLLMLGWGVPETEGRSAAKIASTILLAAAAVVAGLLARGIQPIPGMLVAYGRYMATRLGQADVIYMGEGLTASVAVSRLSNGVLNYHNAGKVQASSEPQDMRLQRMLGHLTTIVPPHVKTVVVIGCGAGVTAGAVSIDPGLTSETIAEIEPLVPRVVSAYFAEHNFDVVRNPKVHINIDDARHFILTSKQKFDAVTSDPLDPWVKGAAMLYTEEFFDAVKEHLNPGGVVTLFVQLYESNTEAVKSEIATFFKSFPNGIIFGNTSNGQGYDLVLFGQVEPTRIDVEAIEAKLRRPEYAPVAQSLREIGFESALDLFATYAGQATDLEPWLRDAQINHDRNLRLQYLAGLGLNLYDAAPIYSDMLQYRRFPEKLFIAPEAVKQQLRDAIDRAPGRMP
ncbi:MAG TPA: fused MFS/spermidine synthase [Vicinamibacterales bacterium]|jgi:spermidine synthase